MNLLKKNKWFAGILTITLVVAACSGNKMEEIDPDISSKEVMTAVLADMQLVESVIRISSNELEVKIDSIDYFTAVFEKHQLTKEQFEKSMNYYTQHPDVLEEIYDAVLVKLSEDQAGYEGVKPAK